MSLVYCCSALWWGWRQKQALVQRRTIWWRHRNLHARTTNSRREYCCWQTRTVSYQKRCTCDSLIINTFIHLKNRKYWVKNSLIIIAVVRIVLTLEYQNSLIVCVRLVLFEQHIQCRPKPPPKQKFSLLNFLATFLVVTFNSFISMDPVYPVFSGVTHPFNRHLRLFKPFYHQWGFFTLQWGPFTLVHPRLGKVRGCFAPALNTWSRSWPLCWSAEAPRACLTLALLWQRSIKRSIR